MEVTVDLIDWEWAADAPDARFFLEEMLEEEDADERFGTDCYQLDGGWTDSATLYLSVSDALPSVMKAIQDSAQRKSFEIGLLPLFSTERQIDALGLKAFPDECYISSIPPDRIRRMEIASADLNLGRISAELDLLVPSTVFQTDDRRRFFEAYLNQWVAALKAATRENMGILIHLG